VDDDEEDLPDMDDLELDYNEMEIKADH